jgi:hypothetical protein
VMIVTAPASASMLSSLLMKTSSFIILLTSFLSPSSHSPLLQTFDLLSGEAS